MKIRFFIATLLSALTFAGCCGDAEKRTILFDGESLMGWNSVLLAGENSDAKGVDVFKLKDKNIYIAGNPFGYIYTENQYSSYRLHAEWRWVGEGTNSGIFLHVQNPDIMWPEAIECQLCAGKAGDFVMLGGSKILDIECKGEFPIKERYGDFEKPVGEWNEVDIECDARTIKVYINGELANSCTTIDSAGHIALQSEGGPIAFRNIYLQEL